MENVGIQCAPPGLKGRYVWAPRERRAELGKPMPRGRKAILNIMRGWSAARILEIMHRTESGNNLEKSPNQVFLVGM